MVAPDIEIADQGVILVSSEEGETEGKASWCVNFKDWFSLGLLSLSPKRDTEVSPKSVKILWHGCF
jgi:hypothetical protein